MIEKLHTLQEDMLAAGLQPGSVITAETMLDDMSFERTNAKLSTRSIANYFLKMDCVRVINGGKGILNRYELIQKPFYGMCVDCFFGGQRKGKTSRCFLLEQAGGLESLAANLAEVE